MSTNWAEFDCLRICFLSLSWWSHVTNSSLPTAIQNPLCKRVPSPFSEKSHNKPATKKNYGPKSDVGKNFCVKETDNVRGFCCCKMGMSSLRTNAECCRITATTPATETFFQESTCSPQIGSQNFDRCRFYVISRLRVQISISSTLTLALVTWFSLPVYLTLSNKPWIV